jgi:hypothetical protein
MTEAEVNDLLGVPPGDYTSGPVQPTNPSLGVIGENPGVFERSTTWLDDRTGVRVGYDDDGKLVCAFGWSHRPRSIFGGFGRLLRSLGLAT